MKEDAILRLFERLGLRRDMGRAWRITGSDCYAVPEFGPHGGFWEHGGSYWRVRIVECPGASCHSENKETPGGGRYCLAIPELRGELQHRLDCLGVRPAGNYRKLNAYLCERADLSRVGPSEPGMVAEGQEALFDPVAAVPVAVAGNPRHLARAKWVPLFDGHTPVQSNLIEVTG